MFALCLYAQDTHVQNGGTSLPEALAHIEYRFGVEVSDPNNLTGGLQAKQTGWRDANTAGLSLIRLLSPHHLMFLKEDDRSYIISVFDTGRRSVEEGKAQLEYLGHRYSDRTSWEARKSVLHSCIREALKLAPFPPAPDSVH